LIADVTPSRLRISTWLTLIFRAFANCLRLTFGTAFLLPNYVILTAIDLIGKSVNDFVLYLHQFSQRIEVFTQAHKLRGRVKINWRGVEDTSYTGDCFCKIAFHNIIKA
jgi:hypothetical protein